MPAYFLGMATKHDSTKNETLFIQCNLGPEGHIYVGRGAIFFFLFVLLGSVLVVAVCVFVNERRWRIVLGIR